MTADPGAALAGREFRAGSRYVLVPWERLAPDERGALEELRAQPDFYGILKPLEPGRDTIRSVGRDTALLLLTMAEPGPLPPWVLQDPGDARSVAELVLDGVLEARDGDRWVAGPVAARLLGIGDGSGEDRPGGRIRQLSLEALQWAAELPLDEPRALAGRLYQYNRSPVTPARASRWRDRAATLDWLEADRVRDEWIPEGTGPWIAFVRPDRAPGSRGNGRGAVNYKLYVSPTLEVLPDILRACALVFAGTGVRRFKVGSDAHGLCRPDKLVAYFPSFEDLARTAHRLRRAIEGAPAQPVPFSAEIDPDGLLSWGLDPPSEAQLPGLRGPESWRVWVTNRLGSALAAGKRAGDALPAWEFALRRLSLDGVDVDRWTPSPSLWNGSTPPGG